MGFREERVTIYYVPGPVLEQPQSRCCCQAPCTDGKLKSRAGITEKPQVSAHGVCCTSTNTTKFSRSEEYMKRSEGNCSFKRNA